MIFSGSSFNRTATALVVILAMVVARDAMAQQASDWQALCSRMVDDEVAAAGIANTRVTEAMRSTPRHEFMPAPQRQYAYYDMALPIGWQQTISPPFVVAYMTEQIDPQPTDKVLEIGTGSGYQAAILSPLVQDVYTIEIVEDLGKRAARTLKRLKYPNVHTKIGDGYLGWPDAAPFDKIIVTCSPEKVPQPLVDQLREGGKMIVPVGERYSQSLHLFTKQAGKLTSQALEGTFFVPMTGQAETLREQHPDPERPTIRNGGFEQKLEGSEFPAAWYYIRQAELTAGQTGQCLRFTNQQPGRGSQALQSFGVDGRRVSELEVEFDIRGDDVVAGQDDRQKPHLVVTFYDDRRASLGSETVGPFEGTFPWRHELGRLAVPVKARDAIVRIGLLGATGVVEFDQITLKAAESAR